MPSDRSHTECLLHHIVFSLTNEFVSFALWIKAQIALSFSFLCRILQAAWGIVQFCKGTRALMLSSRVWVILSQLFFTTLAHRLEFCLKTSSPDQATAIRRVLLRSWVHLCTARIRTMENGNEARKAREAWLFSGVSGCYARERSEVCRLCACLMPRIGMSDAYYTRLLPTRTIARNIYCTSRAFPSSHTHMLAPPAAVSRVRGSWTCLRISFVQVLLST